MALSRLLVVKTTRSMKYNENPIGYGFFCFSKETDYNTNKKKPSSNLHCPKCADRGIVFNVESKVDAVVKYCTYYTRDIISSDLSTFYPSHPRYCSNQRYDFEIPDDYLNNCEDYSRYYYYLT